MFTCSQDEDYVGIENYFQPPVDFELVPLDPTIIIHLCRAPLYKECAQHHGYKGDPRLTPGTCGTIGERAQVILVWVWGPRCWERLPPIVSKCHKGKAMSYK